MIQRPCDICGNTRGHSLHYPREMMFGTEEVFEYLECGYCGCLQITEIPADLGRHYPADDYYSYSPPKQKKYPGWVLKARQSRTRHSLGKRSLLGGLLSAFTKRESQHFDWFRRAGVDLDSRIVDVGCGAGKLLLQLRRDGFSKLLGADPFIAQEIDYGDGLRIRKASLAELEGPFDLLMLHHSYEHMPDPKGVLQELRRLVADDGMVLVRIPVADSYARRKYGVHWFNWDPPRHLYLHTVRSISVLAEMAGFELAEVVYDSGMLQFGSEGRLRRSCRPGNREAVHGRADFTPEEREAVSQFVEQLNLLRDGDTAAFYLRPKRKAG